MSRVIRGSGAWFTERVSREGVSMKYMGPIVAVFLLAICAPAWAVVLPEEVAKKLEQRIDAFVDAPGHERLDVNAMLDGDWYARFEGAGEFALPPDADVDPVTRGMLLFTSKEAPLDTARYRITRHQSSLGGDWPDVRHSYIEITRYNLAPADRKSTRLKSHH